ncbi:MAG TPA: DUF5317 family protein [Acidimicrobiales bacterium]|nr:DUF5317 family protein [Acidimicrobiales bacterium]
MIYIVVAVVGGVLVGVATGGRLANLGEAPFRIWPALAVGVGLQIAANAMRGGTGLALVLASYVLLLVFAAANLARVGMGLVLVGIAMNVVAIAVNGGMPVRGEAIVAAGIASRREIPTIEFGSKRHLETPDDRLTFLGDIIPIGLGPGEVLSFGDLVMAVGIADVIVHLMRQRPRLAFSPPATASAGDG